MKAERPPSYRNRIHLSNLMESFTPTPEITESEVLRAARSMNPKSAPGHDYRLIILLPFTPISQEGGVIELGTFKKLVCRPAKGNLS